MKNDIIYKFSAHQSKHFLINTYYKNGYSEFKFNSKYTASKTEKCFDIWTKYI